MSRWGEGGRTPPGPAADYRFMHVCDLYGWNSVNAVCSKDLDDDRNTFSEGFLHVQTRADDESDDVILLLRRIQPVRARERQSAAVHACQLRGPNFPLDVQC